MMIEQSLEATLPSPGRRLNAIIHQAAIAPVLYLSRGPFCMGSPVPDYSLNLGDAIWLLEELRPGTTWMIDARGPALHLAIRPPAMEEIDASFSQGTGPASPALALAIMALCVTHAEAGSGFGGRSSGPAVGAAAWALHDASAAQGWNFIEGDARAILKAALA